MFNFLSGYKMYLASAAAAITAISQYANGSIDLTTTIVALIGAFGFAGLKSALAKAGTGK